MSHLKKFLGFVCFIVLAAILSASLEVHSAATEHFNEPSFSKPVIYIPNYGKPKTLQYAGYLNTASGRGQLYHWFFEKEDSMLGDNTPILIWLNGGPGCSSFTGLLDENGPFRFIGKSHNLQDFEYTWQKLGHMLFVDQPVGTGLSVANEYVTNQDQVAEDFYSALKEFYIIHPEYARNPLYITGESYAGKYIPSIADYILTKNEDSEFKINLKGVAIGNGLIYPNIQRLIKADQIFNDALIDYTQRETLQDTLLQCSAHIQNQDLYPGACDRYRDFFTIGSGGINLYDLRRFDETTNRTRREMYINTPEFRENLHAPFSKKQAFVGCDNTVAEYLERDVLRSTKHLLPRLVKSGIQVLIFAGNFDLKDGPVGHDQMFLSTKFFREDMDYKNIRRDIFLNSKKEVAGYVRQKDNFAFVTLFGAGHYVPTDQGNNALEMIRKFLKNERFCANESFTFRLSSNSKLNSKVTATKKCYEVAKVLCETTTNNCNGNGVCDEIGNCICRDGWAGKHCGWRKSTLIGDTISFELLNQHWHHVDTSIRSAIIGRMQVVHHDHETEEYLEGKIVGEGLGTNLPWNKVCIFGKKGEVPTYRSYHFVHCQDVEEDSTFVAPEASSAWKFAIWNGAVHPINVKLIINPTRF